LNEQAALTLAKRRHYTSGWQLLLHSGEGMSLSAVIVDDEQLARDELAYLLKNAGESISLPRAKTASKR